MKFFTSFLFLLILTTVHAQTTLFVDANASGNNTGLSWNDAYTDLQNALSAATSGTTIMVAQGTYIPTTTTDRNLSFNIPEGVALLGGYATGGTERDSDAFRTILSGDIGITSENTDNSYHVVRFDAVTNVTSMDGFQIQDGYADATGGDNSIGGGIFTINAASPSLSNLVISSNFADQRAGGLYITIDAQPVVEGLTFTNNSSNGSGGALYNDAQPAYVIENCSFIGNISDFGGAVYNNFQNNTTYSSCEFINNSAEFGGAIYDNAGVTNTYISNVFSSNNATVDGGAIFNNFESFTTNINCLFVGNSSGNRAGAVFGGVSSEFTLINATFVSNTATNSEGGAIHSSTTSGSIVLIHNSVFYQNTDANGVSDITGNSLNGLSTHNASDISGSLLDNGNTFVLLEDDPFLNSTNSEGEDGIFRTTDDGLFPSETSVLIDTANNANISELEDITANARIFNTTVDIGAYEFFSVLSTNNPKRTSLAFYPNPVKDKFQLDLNKDIIESISIYSVQGKLLKTLQNIDAATTTVDISQLPSSLYVLIVKTQQDEKVLKITKS